MKKSNMFKILHKIGKFIHDLFFEKYSFTADEMCRFGRFVNRMKRKGVFLDSSEEYFQLWKYHGYGE